MYTIGDRIKIIKKVVELSYSNLLDEFGTIINISSDNMLLIEFDNNIRGHNGLGTGENLGKLGHCWWVDTDDISFLDKSKKINIQDRINRNCEVLYK